MVCYRHLGQEVAGHWGVCPVSILAYALFQDHFTTPAVEINFCVFALQTEETDSIHIKL